MPKVDRFNKDVVVISIFWLICATAMFFYKWESVSTLNLNDNDDYMRLVQLQEWMENGHWYLEPMLNFNAADGLIIHWSRFPDLILSLFTFPMLFFVDESTAYSLSLSIVPLVYLLLYALSCFYLCDHYFGGEYRFISMMFAISSPTIVHFLPGSIDHHNIQLILSAFFLSITPITINNLKQTWRVYLQSVVLSLSLWTGMDNILLFMFFFVFYTVYSCFVNHEWLGYISKVYISCAFFVTCSILLNRPYHEFYNFKFDEVSSIFSILFISGWLFINAYRRWVNLDDSFPKKLMFFLSLGLFFLSPALFLYPSLASGFLVDYPPILKTYWLDHVNEAKPVAEYIVTNGFFSVQNYALLLLPAILYPLFRINNQHCTILYLIFIFNLTLAVFWQIRAMRLCFVLAAPFQAYFVIKLSEFVRYSILKVIVIFSGAPLTVALVILALSPSEEVKTIFDDGMEAPDILKVLEGQGISSQTILSGIETGAPVLAKTNNKIIAAPYHRNITGNSFLIGVMLEEDPEIAKRKIIDKNIDIIVIGNDPHLSLLNQSASDGSFVKVLYGNDVPVWLDMIYDALPRGYRVFRVRGRDE